MLTYKYDITNTFFDLSLNYPNHTFEIMSQNTELANGQPTFFRIDNDKFEISDKRNKWTKMTARKNFYFDENDFVGN